SGSPWAMQSRFTTPRMRSSVPRRFASDEAPCADEADLFRSECAERDRARTARPGGKALREAAKALDAGRVVDRAGAAPHRVVVSGDDDRLLARAGDDRDDVALGAARDEAAADPHACGRVLHLE